MRHEGGKKHTDTLTGKGHREEKWWKILNTSFSRRIIKKEEFGREKVVTDKCHEHKATYLEYEW